MDHKLPQQKNFYDLYLSMDLSNMPRNCLREVWYMTLTMDICTMRK